MSALLDAPPADRDIRGVREDRRTDTTTTGTPGGGWAGFVR
jgi:hypothetical protein